MSNNALMTALEFSADDLQENRQARLSEAQLDRLKKLQSRAVMWGVGLFYAFALVATALLFLGQREENTILSFAGVMVTVWNAILVGTFARQWLRFWADLRGDTVRVAEGVLERVVRAYGRANNFVLRVDGQSFSVTQDTFKQFTHETSYKLYYTTHTHILLCAEKAAR